MIVNDDNLHGVADVISKRWSGNMLTLPSQLVSYLGSFGLNNEQSEAIAWGEQWDWENEPIETINNLKDFSDSLYLNFDILYCLLSSSNSTDIYKTLLKLRKTLGENKCNVCREIYQSIIFNYGQSEYLDIALRALEHIGKSKNLNRTDYSKTPLMVIDNLGSGIQPELINIVVNMTEQQKMKLLTEAVKINLEDQHENSSIEKRVKAFYIFFSGTTTARVINHLAVSDFLLERDIMEIMCITQKETLQSILRISENYCSESKELIKLSPVINMKGKKLFLNNKFKKMWLKEMHSNQNSLIDLEKYSPNKLKPLQSLSQGDDWCK